MTVITVPPSLTTLLDDLEGVTVLPWDMQDEPPRIGEVELVVAPNSRSPWLKRLAELPRLRTLQLGSAGFEHAVAYLPDGVVLANAVGVHDTATAELALALMLAAQRDLPTAVRQQAEGSWAPPPRPQRAVADATVLVLGYGGVGTALARRLVACEARVVAVASTARGGDDLVEVVHGIEELPDLLPTADIVALSTPLTEATRGLLDARALALLPDDALVVNVARGGVVDTDALVAECASGRLRAALDVTDPEPLPADHPLWHTPGVLVSPHVGGHSVAYPARMARFVRAQVAAYVQQGQVDHVVATGTGG